MQRGRIGLENALFRDAGQPVIVADLSRVIIDVNPAFEQMFGYDRCEMIGRPGPSFTAMPHRRGRYRKTF
jgi:PAS domain S-box-containing protein